jgi:predicted dinucleotide-binding enzyme
MNLRLTVCWLFLSPLAVLADTVAVIGTGNVGMALGSEFAGLGHDVIYGSRSPESEKTQDVVVKASAAAAMLPADAAAEAEIVVLAVPGMATEAVAGGLGDLSGKLIIDATNPLVFEGNPPTVSYGVETSLGEIVQGLHPDAFVVKAFNTISWPQMMDPGAASTPPVVPIAGNDEASRNRVAAYVSAMDLDPLDLGGIENAQWTERTVVVALNNAFTGKEKFDVILQRRD